MSIIKPKSKQALSGQSDSKPQSMAMAMDMQRRGPKKKKMMAQGGPVSAKSESRPMPNQDKPSIKMDPAPMSIPKPRLQPINQPSMAASPVIKSRPRSDIDQELMKQHEEHIMRSMPPEDETEHIAYDDSHALESDMMAEGGEVAHPHVDDMSEQEEEHHMSIAAAIMAKRDRMKAMDSDSDEDSQMMMAEGGEIPSHESIYSDDSDQADLSRNADEDANEEDQLSFNAMRKENYSESEGLEQLDSPMDSNEHGDDREDSKSDKKDMISQIRSKMNRQRQFPQR